VSSRALLEIAANSLDSALAAEAGGADRIELCSGLELGGLTPSAGLIEQVREHVRIPVYVLIRPRAGDCVYTDAEFDAMRRDVARCVALGCEGVVIGALTPHGALDTANLRGLIGAASGRGVTLHRAFDLCMDPPSAMEDAIALGCERVLTSGGAPSALAGAATIRRLVEQAGDRIRIMPGAGIDARNIAAIREQTGAREFHASAKRQLASRQTSSRGEALGMSNGEWRSDAEQVRALAAVLSSRPHS